MIDFKKGDCLQYMKTYEDNYFDIAIVDPPYGIGVNKMTLGNGKNKVYRGKENWDNNSPEKEYFDELRRISKNQIIWGANHFISKIPVDSSCWIVWDKGTGENDFADCELAWTSFGSTVRKYFKSWVGANAKENDERTRIHPTQKPVDLYKWLLTKYAKSGDKIIDTHIGSGSIILACYDLNFDLTGFEIDEGYYNGALKRFQDHTMQYRLNFDD